jgi:hypothetical protein
MPASRHRAAETEWCLGADSGQTGAGKTYTMHGPNVEAEDCHTNEQRGLLPRTLEYLFAQIAREQRKVRRVHESPAYTVC